MIPFLDLEAQYRSLKEEVDTAMHDVVMSRQFILGPKVKAFEEAFASFQGVKRCVGVSNGTSALFLALKALGIGPGDEVITVPNTFIATTEAITAVGADIRFVDVDPKTKLMDPALIEAAITPKTKALLPVHLHGQLCDMPRIAAIAEKHGLMVVEDAAQAHGASLDGRRAGQLSQAATFSFYPGKNLGAYGDAGAIITDDEGLADRLVQLRNHGRAPGKKYEHELEAFNERMDDLQAAVLLVKLKRLDAWNERRREIAAKYGSLLEGVVGMPGFLERAGPVHHIYAIEVDDRDALLVFLKEKGVGVGIHYPIPLHLQPAYAHLGLGKGSFPVAERLADRMLSLPIYPEMKDAQVDEVCALIKGFMDRSSSP